MTDNTVTIPPEAAILINRIITADEGGWVLTENKDDPDGGWTYAGVTERVFASFMDSKPFNIPLSWIKHELALREGIVKEETYHIYYINYYLPLQLDKMPTNLRGPLFSCAVNIGVESAIKVLQLALNQDADDRSILNDGKLGPTTLASIRNCNQDFLYNDFLHQWALHYAEIVKNNAQDWKLAADAMFTDNQRIRGQLPKVLFANNLSGWLNRIERWRL